ncbi:NUDIX domain-containing protein [Agrococcus sp. SL85]|uniref:NUDIX domain-containing protein n=1 Tax=Agrococcus sp. SL85 TaxID=2995141 RepID=UPI00226CC3EE|nr:NUDIX domain-containing protein [Agrococcus sp. SL85]WAC65952.1 NUDIX domain-containing protein [Agrococcus sp. SL85]
MSDDARPGGIRRSARVVCVDPAGATLLLLHEWSGRGAPARWLTVGGGIDAGETEREAALRELREETGRAPDPSELIGPVRHVRQPTPPGHRYDALDMTAFVWRTPRFAADASGREPGETASIRDERWWTADEIAASADPFDAEDALGTLALVAGGEPAQGERVRVRASKWDGTPHWTYDAVALGSDAEGVWLGVDGPTTRFWKPGVDAFLGDERKVMLVPRRPLAMLEGTWALVHWLVGGELALYIDVCTPPELVRRPEGWVLDYCDLDLDVVRRPRGVPWIDDEDEFAEHAARMAYPAWVRERVRATADALLAGAQMRTAPGEYAREHWHRRLDALVPPAAGA